MERLYIIKNAGAWMMDELVVFAELTKFNILFLRKQNVFYDDKIKLLKEKGVGVIYVKTRNSFSLSKLSFCFLFIIRHLNCFLNIHSLIYGLKSISYFLKTELKVFRKEQISIHCQFATQSAIVGLMLKEYFNKDVSYSFTFHAYDIYVKNLWFNSLAANAVKLYSISNYNISYVFNHYSIVDKAKVIYSPLGAFAPEVFEKNKKSDLLRMGFLSYFIEMKGINYLLPAIKQLKKANIPFILNIAGDGPLKNKMILFVEQNNLKENVVFHGLIKNEKKDFFFRNLDLFILPSISKGMKTDGLPVVLMEAVSYGLPIISTNVSGIPEICIDDYNGYLIEQKSIEEVVNAVIKFSKNRSRWAEFSHNSLEISRKYDIIINSKQKLKMLEWQ